MISNYGPTQFPYLIQMKVFEDSRGILQTFDTSILTFQIERIFSITPITELTTRGGHAHKTCWQAIFPIFSKLKISGKNMMSEFEFALKPGFALVVPPLNWIEIFFDQIESGAVVLCSHTYDSKDYIVAPPS
jgi:hypothetical protein